MSKVYSFRLDADNPREAQAMDVISTWASQGYSLRHILTDALIGYGDNGDAKNGWNLVYDQLSELVLGLENGEIIRQPIDDNPSLSPDFVDAIRKTAKEGIKTK